jgi:cytidine deaminase
MSDHKWNQRIERLVQQSNGAWLPAEAVERLRREMDLSIDDLMLALIPIAVRYAQAPLSNFQVGAVGWGESGALYFGANLELPGCPLSLAVHAEQSVVIHAFHRQETRLKKLAVSAPPCGYCRQFLYELHAGAQLEIVLAGRPTAPLSDYLPGAFGPADLGLSGGLLNLQQRQLEWVAPLAAPDALAQLALAAASTCYAPYTKTVSGVALELGDGETYAGAYLENAAFNPSVAPLQSALAVLSLARRSAGEIVRVVVVQQERSAVDHAAATREVLRQIATDARCEERRVRLSINYPQEAPVAKSSPAKLKQKDLSFYFFDFDDNLMFLKTPILLRSRSTQKVKQVSTADFARIRATLGAPGDWEDFEAFDQTYSRFRDIPAAELRKNQRQHFVNDVAKEIAKELSVWQAPSWPLFQYACEQQRPVALVTARGHSRETIQAGIRLLVQEGFLPQEPNYLAIYGVGNDEVKRELIGSLVDGEEKQLLTKLVKAKKDVTSPLKRVAIRQAVEKALEIYGADPPHRFGMSDDDPENVDLIVKAMCDCKVKHPDKRFFVINTHRGEWVKLEVFPIDYPVTRQVPAEEIIG